MPKIKNSVQIIEKSIYDLKPYERNPRNNDDAVPAVAASIQRFGFKVPAVIDKAGVLATGHTRLKAVKMLVEKYGDAVPRLDKNGKPTGETLDLTRIPCVLADDLTPAEIREFRLADNKTSELSSWNDELLREERIELDAEILTEFGFDELLLEEDTTGGGLRKLERRR